MAPDKPGVFVVFSWSPEGRSLISVVPQTPPGAALAMPARRKEDRRQGFGRWNGWITTLMLLAIGGFALGFALRLAPLG